MPSGPTRSEPGEVTVEVIEPEDHPKTPLALPSPDSDQIGRIPRKPSPTSVEPRVHRLSKKKAAVLADKQAKRDRKIKKKVAPRNKRF